ncbi:MAG: helicase-related protein, partial [bacterium]|nr:helicase-related protein [bacterium]
KEIKIKARTFYSYIGDRCPSLVNMRKISDYSAANNINVFEDKSLFDGTYYYDKIKKIKTVVSKNYDFVIPGSKTFIGNGLINHNTIVAAKIIQELGVAPFIFYVLTKDLMEQARERIEQSIIGTQCGVIGDGKCDIQDINVVTIQTAIRAFEKDSSSEEHKINDFLKFDDYEEFDIEQLKKEDMSHLEKKREEIKKLILNCRGMYADECHHISAQTCQEVISKSTKSYYMFGGSATPIRSDNSDLLIEGLLGRKSTIVSASHLIRLGYLMRPDIYYIKMKQNNSGPIFSYEDDLQLNLINNESRNRHISTIAQTMSEKNLSTLILISRIEHGKILNTMIPNSVFIYGETDSKKRTETLQMLREKKILICIASTIGDEGLDIPTLNCVIIAGGGKSPIKCKQKVGRAIRMYPEKKMSIIFDFLDKGKYLTRHSKKRMFLLKQEPEFNIKTIESFDIKEHYTQDVF